MLKSAAGCRCTDVGARLWNEKMHQIGLHGDIDSAHARAAEDDGAGCRCIADEGGASGILGVYEGSEMSYEKVGGASFRTLPYRPVGVYGCLRFTILSTFWSLRSSMQCVLRRAICIDTINFTEIYRRLRRVRPELGPGEVTVFF